MATPARRPQPVPLQAARESQPAASRYVGTLVGESTSREFRLAVAHETVREQDIIAVDGELHAPDGVTAEKVRIWAKVQRIERVNPLFPSEAGHELAATWTDPFDTVLSLSREMVTAVCQVLGAEPVADDGGGKLDQLRYPAKPATSAYRPTTRDISRVVLGELQYKQRSALDIATLANRPDVHVSVDGHAIVTRHLAILAMTGAGKSWTARRVIEQLAAKNYPVVIFDPHGDYTGLAEVPALRDKVRRYYARLPIFEEDSETVAEIVNSLGYELNENMRTRFGDLFQAARWFIQEGTPAAPRRGPNGCGQAATWQEALIPDEQNALADGDDPDGIRRRTAWLAEVTGRNEIVRYGLQPDMWLIANLAEAGQIVLQGGDAGMKQRLQDWGWPGFTKYTGRDASTLEAIKKRAYRAAAVLRRMERTNQHIARNAEPLPLDRSRLVDYGTISVVSLAGYTGDFQATIYSLIADAIFDARVRKQLGLPVVLVLEEAHNFVPGRGNTTAEARAIATTKQIAQEGRKFQVGLILIRQRPSRLDETTLSQCNSYIIMRMVNPADQQFVRRVVETLGEDEAHMLPDLEVGEALLSGQLTNFPVLVRIKPPESHGEREERDAFEELERARAGLPTSSST